MSAVSNRPIPASRPERVDLIKKLLSARVASNASLWMTLWSFGGSVDDLSDEQLLTAPEAGVLAFYEQYTPLVEAGALEEEAIRALHAAYAASFTMAGINPPEIQSPVTFESYAKLLLDCGNITGVPIDPELLPLALLEIRKFYGR